MERGIVARESNLPFRAIPAAALRGRAPWTMARNAATLARGTRAALGVIAQERPAAILGTGGYVCVPLFLAARAARVPAAVYLPDVVPGLAVRLLARLAAVVACNVEDSARYFRSHIADRKSDSPQSARDNRRSAIYVVGYPVRAELFDLDRRACRAAFALADDLPALLVYGGSRGARSINQAIAALLPELLPLAQIIHVCGREGDARFLQDAAARLPAELRARYRLYDYLHSDRPDQGARRPGDTAMDDLARSLPVSPSMLAALGAADLAVCRSGASTLAELPAVGLPAVLVPYPYVHQDENADYLVRRGAAVKVADGAMLGAGAPADGPLFREIRRLLAEPEARARMAANSRALARPDAARRLADLVLNLAAGGALA